GIIQHGHTVLEQCRAAAGLQALARGSTQQRLLRRAGGGARNLVVDLQHHLGEGGTGAQRFGHLRGGGRGIAPAGCPHQQDVLARRQPIHMRIGLLHDRIALLGGKQIKYVRIDQCRAAAPLPGNRQQRTDDQYREPSGPRAMALGRLTVLQSSAAPTRHWRCCWHRYRHHYRYWRYYRYCYWRYYRSSAARKTRSR